ncbi:MAG: purine-nucleoside phosphorylase [Ginsengibacter sp.]
MENMLEKVNEAVSFIKSKSEKTPEFAIILGTGLGSFIDHLQIEESISYEDIPHFPKATVEFHKGRLILGSINERRVVVMQGRFHYYEGYSMRQVTFPVRVMKDLGVKYLLLSNAAGGINSDLHKGDLVLVDDHINLMPENPLRGLNDRSFGNRFVDLSCPYDKMLCTKLLDVAKKENIVLKIGIYASVQGPNLETRSEYRFLSNAGADMVGMSTVPEVIVANHISLPCAAISVITDECNPDDLKPVNIAEIIEVAGKADKVLSKLLVGVIGRM